MEKAQASRAGKIEGKIKSWNFQIYMKAICLVFLVIDNLPRFLKQLFVWMSNQFTEITQEKPAWLGLKERKSH